MALTGFGDAALLLPLAAAIWVWLVASGGWRAAWWWAAAVLVCASLTALLKIFFWGCPPVSDLHSPSGHASLSTLVYGAMAVLVAFGGGHVRVWLAGAAAAAIVTAIAVSRLLLDAHSLPEVVVGASIGCGSLFVFVLRYRRVRPEDARLAPLLVVAAALISALHGSELRAEELLHRITFHLGIRCHASRDFVPTAHGAYLTGIGAVVDRSAMRRQARTALKTMSENR